MGFVIRYYIAYPLQDADMLYNTLVKYILGYLTSIWTVYILTLSKIGRGRTKICISVVDYTRGTAHAHI